MIRVLMPRRRERKRKGWLLPELELMAGRARIMAGQLSSVTRRDPVDTEEIHGIRTLDEHDDPEAS